MTGQRETPRTNAAWGMNQDLIRLYGTDEVIPYTTDPRYNPWALARELECTAADLRERLAKAEHDLMIQTESAKQLGRWVQIKDDDRVFFRDKLKEAEANLAAYEAAELPEEWSDAIESLDNGHITTNADVQRFMQQEIDALRILVKALAAELTEARTMLNSEHDAHHAKAEAALHFGSRTPSVAENLDQLGITSVKAYAQKAADD